MDYFLSALSASRLRLRSTCLAAFFARTSLVFNLSFERACAGVCCDRANEVAWCAAVTARGASCYASMAASHLLVSTPNSSSFKAYFFSTLATSASRFSTTSSDFGDACAACHAERGDCGFKSEKLRESIKPPSLLWQPPPSPKLASLPLFLLHRVYLLLVRLVLKVSAVKVVPRTTGLFLDFGLKCTLVNTKGGSSATA
eukprot:5646724-Pleurochrysis_carterae.AAC.1